MRFRAYGLHWLGRRTPQHSAKVEQGLGIYARLGGSGFPKPILGQVGASGLQGLATVPALKGREPESRKLEQKKELDFGGSLREGNRCIATTYFWCLQRSVCMRVR